MEERAAEQIIKDIEKELELTMFDHYYGHEPNANHRTGLKEFVVKRVDDFFAENKDELLDRAAKVISDKLYRSKAFAAKVEAITKEAGR